MNSLLILDGISGVPLGLELRDAFNAVGITANYADLRKFESRLFYGIAAGFRKAMNRRETSDSFYHLPKLNEERFKKYLEQERPSVILVIGYVYKYLSPSFLKEMSLQFGIRLFLYDTDSCNFYAKRREFIFFLDNELPIYDEIFSFSRVTTHFFSYTKKLKASVLPFGANNIEVNHSSPQSIDVLFVGSCDLRRIFLLENIKEKVTIFGARWNRNFPLISEELRAKVSDESVWGDDLYKLLADSKIVLNITRSHFYGAETGINLRIFEALAAGCFLLTDYCEELEELFVIGEEIEVFRSGRELMEKVEFYLANPSLRQRIAQQGHEQFLKKHQWTSRALELASRMQIEKNA